MREQLVVIGGGGMGRCILDVIDVLNRDMGGLPGGPRYDVLGVVADPEPDVSLLVARGVKYLGPVNVLEELPADVGFVIGIGSGQARAEIDARFRKRPSPVLVHPNVHLGFDVDLGPGSVVCSHVSIETGVRLGRHVHVNQNATVGHDSVLTDYVTVSPLAAISGNVRAGEAAFFGAGSSVHERTTIGPHATVGMGAAVIDEVPEGATVVGVPARVR